MSITLSELSKAFKKAIIIDLDKKSVWIVREGKVKVYPEQYYQQLISGLDLGNFGDDTK